VGQLDLNPEGGRSFAVVHGEVVPYATGRQRGGADLGVPCRIGIAVPDHVCDHRRHLQRASVDQPNHRLPGQPVHRQPDRAKSIQNG